MTGERRDGFGHWPSADEVARVGGPVRPVATDGGTDDGDEAVPGDVADLSRSLRRRIETTLAADETAEAFLAYAWSTHRGLLEVDTLADAARVECFKRDIEVDTVRLTPEVTLPRATWERIWYRYLDELDRRDDTSHTLLDDTINEFLEFLPTLVVPADPERGREELVVELGEWPVVPRHRDGEPIEPDVDQKGDR